MNRTIYPVINIADEKTGVCEYVASDESVDSQMEIVRVSGWKFDRFEKNAPFLNSHNSRSIEAQLGKVLGAYVDGKRLVETVQWAIDVPENRLAQLGWAMTKAGYLKAVSVGFLPTKLVTRIPIDEWPTGSDWMGAAIASANMREGKKVWAQQMAELGRPEGESKIQTVYIEQQQTELSACIIGSNPNAVAKSYKAGVLNDADLELLSLEYAKCETAKAAASPADAALARQRARTAFLVGVHRKINRI